MPRGGISPHPLSHNSYSELTQPKLVTNSRSVTHRQVRTNAAIRPPTRADAHGTHNKHQHGQEAARTRQGDDADHNRRSVAAATLPLSTPAHPPATNRNRQPTQARSCHVPPLRQPTQDAAHRDRQCSALDCQSLSHSSSLFLPHNAEQATHRQQSLSACRLSARHRAVVCSRCAHMRRTTDLAAPCLLACRLLACA